MKFHTKFIPQFALLALLSAIPLRAQLAKGAPFPTADQAALEGVMPATAGKVTVVDFFASWCTPCKASFPALDQLSKAYASRGVVFVGVSVDEKSAAYNAFLQKHPVAFATVRDKDKVLVNGAKVPAMPTTYVLGRDGKVRAVFAGYHGDKTEQELKAALEAALSE